MKRIIPLVLSLLVIISTFAFAVYADEASTYAIACENCTGGQYLTSIKYYQTGSIGWCELDNNYKHTFMTKYRHYECNNCHDSYDVTIETYEYCRLKEAKSDHSYIPDGT